MAKVVRIAASSDGKLYAMDSDGNLWEGHYDPDEVNLSNPNKLGQWVWRQIPGPGEE